jgi:hypothetical protein
MKSDFCLLKSNLIAVIFKLMLSSICLYRYYFVSQKISK